MLRNDKQEDSNEQMDFLEMEDLTAALSVPSETFPRAAVALKDQIVQSTWKEDLGQGVDPTFCTGLLGTAFTCLKSYEATGDRRDLQLCTDIVDTCAVVFQRDVTFLSGRAGVYALGAVVAEFRDDSERRRLFLDLFEEVAQERALPVGPDEGGFGMSYELHHGRAGFLWAVLFINKHLGQDTVPRSLVMPVVEAVLAGGRVGASDNPLCPLMYRWHGTRYWAAAHGLAGILHVLLHFPLSQEDMEDVKGTLRYMVRNRFLQSGNYPSSEGNPRDKLVQWSHGATGVAIALCKAAQVFPHEREFRNAAIEAGEVVWKKGLVRKVGLADGVSGNAYALLSLYRLTKEDVYKERAEAFAGFLYHNAGKMVEADRLKGGDYHTYSLFHGLAGTACLWFDIASPEKSMFPGFEL
ncbi:lanC-like protein GCL1 isoform X2 [Aristolochia californica]|uniref:lanC-like protein GCL1 isoform X2 n=1 Tax=Aristolochia californica TaxID=171875 RepID=UPI0035E16E25